MPTALSPRGISSARLQCVRCDPTADIGLAHHCPRRNVATIGQHSVMFRVDLKAAGGIYAIWFAPVLSWRDRVVGSTVRQPVLLGESVGASGPPRFPVAMSRWREDERA